MARAAVSGLGSLAGDFSGERRPELAPMAAGELPRPEGIHVGREEEDVEEVVGHVAADDAIREALHDGRLAHAGLADEDGVLLAAARQDAHHAADLLVAADDGVQLPGLLDEVTAVRLERLEVGVASPSRSFSSSARTRPADTPATRASSVAESPGRTVTLAVAR
ncbi:unnamed protein product [Miscanthus lutarioriparius]|uniref:Uncharacterized protein n=1 Tax=Miscanthus lutarioriparius TaxID=422564 RepID=A0A811R2K6_9POAL|nr:unnamed protein product [Miscanthus lutarioriparius]